MVTIKNKLNTIYIVLVVVVVVMNCYLYNEYKFVVAKNSDIEFTVEDEQIELELINKKYLSDIKGVKQATLYFKDTKANNIVEDSYIIHDNYASIDVTLKAEDADKVNIGDRFVGIATRVNTFDRENKKIFHYYDGINFYYSPYIKNIESIQKTKLLSTDLALVVAKESYKTITIASNAMICILIVLWRVLKSREYENMFGY